MLKEVLEVDRIFTMKQGLLQSLMVQEGTHNPNVTLKGYPKKFWDNKSHYFNPPKEAYP